MASGDFYSFEWDGSNSVILTVPAGETYLVLSFVASSLNSYAWPGSYTRSNANTVQANMRTGSIQNKQQPLVLEENTQLRASALSGYRGVVTVLQVK